MKLDSLYVVLTPTPVLLPSGSERNVHSEFRDARTASEWGVW